MPDPTPPLTPDVAQAVAHELRRLADLWPDTDEQYVTTTYVRDVMHAHADHITHTCR